MNDWSEAEQHVDRAHELYEMGRWDEAVAELKRALALNPYRAEWHFNLGLTLEEAGKFEAAIDAFRSAHDLDASDVQTLLCLGVNLNRVDRAREAVACFEKTAELDPALETPFCHRIESYALLGEHEQAEVMFYMARQFSDACPLCYSNLADSLLLREEHERAVWCLREAASLDPHMPRVHARLADAYWAMGRLERARQLFLRELREAPGDTGTLLDLGCLLMETGRLPESGEKFRQVLELDPVNVDAHFYLGELARQEHRPEDAFREYELVQSLSPTYDSVRRRLAGLLIEAGRIDAARGLLREEYKALMDEEKLAEDALSDLGELHLEAGQTKRATRVFAKLVEASPTNVDHLHKLAVASFRSGDRGKGIECCRKVLRKKRRFVPAMHNLALAYLEEGQWRRAGYWVRQALAVDPEDECARRLRLHLSLHSMSELLTSIGEAILRRWRKRSRLLSRKQPEHPGD